MFRTHYFLQIWLRYWILGWRASWWLKRLRSSNENTLLGGSVRTQVLKSSVQLQLFSCCTEIESWKPIDTDIIMTNRIVSWNPFEKHQFVLNGTKLELFEVNNHNDDTTDNVQKVNLNHISSAEPNQLSCIDWHPCDETSLLAYGTSQGEVHLKNWQKSSEVLYSRSNHLHFQKNLCFYLGFGFYSRENWSKTMQFISLEQTNFNSTGSWIWKYQKVFFSNALYFSTLTVNLYQWVLCSCLGLRAWKTSAYIFWRICHHHGVAARQYSSSRHGDCNWMGARAWHPQR